MKKLMMGMLVAAAAVIFSACGSGSSGGGDTVDAVLLLSRSSLTVERAGTGDILVTATDTSGTADSFTAAASNGIVTVATSGSTITCTGVSVGSSIISVTSGSGIEKTCTVTVCASGALEITGTAAVGAPVKGIVYIKDAEGATVSGPIDEDGGFSINISGLTAPYIIMADGYVLDKKVTLYSVTSVAGTNNVTPATNTVVAMALGQDPATAYDPDTIKADGTDVINETSYPAASKVEVSKQKVSEALAPLYVELEITEFDVMSGTFTADGEGFDKVLDVVSFKTTEEGSDTGVAVTNKLTGATLLSDNDVSDETEATLDATAAAAAADASGDIDEMKRLYGLWMAAWAMPASVDSNSNGTPDRNENESVIRNALEEMFHTDFYAESKTRAEFIDQLVANVRGTGDNFFAADTVTSCTIIEPQGSFTADSSTIGSSIIIDSTIFSLGTKSFTVDPSIVRCFITDRWTQKVGEDPLTHAPIYESGSQLATVSYVKVDGKWKISGGGAPCDRERTHKDIRGEYDDSTSQWTVEGGINFSFGFEYYDDGTGNPENYDYDATNIDAVLVLADGITEDIPSPDAVKKKGLLLVKDADYEDGGDKDFILRFSSVNFASNFYVPNGDIAKDLRCVGLKLVSGTYEPVSTWVVSLGLSGFPVIDGTNRGEYFPVLTSDNLIGFPYDLSGTTNGIGITAAWSMPELLEYNFGEVALSDGSSNSDYGDSSWFSLTGSAATLDTTGDLTKAPGSDRNDSISEIEIILESCLGEAQIRAAYIFK